MPESAGISQVNLDQRVEWRRTSSASSVDLRRLNIAHVALRVPVGHLFYKYEQPTGYRFRPTSQQNARSPQFAAIGSRSIRDRAVIGDVRGGAVPLRIDRLTESTDIVIRAQGLPRLKNLLGRERPFFLGITDGVKTKRTQAARRKEQYVAWTFMLSGFNLESDPDITIRVLAKRML
ncbi:hypothetical protein FA95DRAFT_1578582, partial [Auriscalpium vulgare]